MLTDVLVLGMARTRSGLSIAGMTTEPDPITGLRWVRPVRAGAPLTLDDLRYDDGTLIRLGDVVQLDLQQPEPTPPHVENVIANWDEHPPAFIRELTEARRAAFFPKHLDPAPADVVVRRQRSLCLVRPDTVEAMFGFDEETERFEARLVLTIGKLHNEDGVPVADLYWREWGRQQLGEEEYLELDHPTLQQMLGEVYVTLGLGPRGGPLVIGVHTIPAYAVELDAANL